MEDDHILVAFLIVFGIVAVIAIAPSLVDMQISGLAVQELGGLDRLPENHGPVTASVADHEIPLSDQSILIASGLGILLLAISLLVIFRHKIFKPL